MRSIIGSDTSRTGCTLRSLGIITGIGSLPGSRYFALERLSNGGTSVSGAKMRCCANAYSGLNEVERMSHIGSYETL